MDQKMKGIMRVEPYNPEWKNEFQKIKEMITSCIGDLVICVEHIGSTAIEGLPSKPIIDIDVVMDSYEVFPSVKDRLSKIGFEHEGNLGVEGREAFRRTFIDDFMAYHMYVCPRNGKGHIEHMIFRDYLRNHKEEMQAYGQLKMKLAEQYRTDINSYANGKCDFVKNILQKANKE
jgi:GrpB-like predicted nucleotidyltransferase (UPF0157 family)